jgi:hypothetical protein
MNLFCMCMFRDVNTVFVSGIFILIGSFLLVLSKIRVNLYFNLIN